MGKLLNGGWDSLKRATDSPRIRLLIYIASLLVSAGIFYGAQATRATMESQTIVEHTTQIRDLLSWSRAMAEAQGRTAGDIQGLLQALSAEAEARRHNTDDIRSLEDEVYRRHRKDR